MEEKLMRYLKVFFTLTFLSIVLVIALLLWDVVFVSHAPTYITQVSPSSPLELRVESLEKGLESLQRDLVSQLNHKLYYFGGIALLISGIATFFGWRTFKDLDGLIQEKIRTTLEKQLYQLDITNQKIWIISNEKTEKDMAEISKRLDLSGLPYYEEITKLDNHSFRGISIVPVLDEAMEKEFVGYLKRNADKLFEDKAAFILYTKRHHIKETIPFRNYTFANMPVTAVSHILTVGRGLPSTKSEKEDK